MHVQSVQNCCFSSSNMRIRDVLIAVVRVVALALFAKLNTVLKVSSQIAGQSSSFFFLQSQISWF